MAQMEYLLDLDNIISTNTLLVSKSNLFLHRDIESCEDRAVFMYSVAQCIWCTDVKLERIYLYECIKWNISGKVIIKFQLICC